MSTGNRERAHIDGMGDLWFLVMAELEAYQRLGSRGEKS